MTTRNEQETTVTHVRNEGKVYIYSANPVHLRKLRKDERATEIRGDADSAEFVVLASDYDPMRGFKSRRKPMSDEQRAATAARLAQYRQNQP